MTNTDSEIKAPWLAMIIIAMGQALMSFNVAALPVSVASRRIRFGARRARCVRMRQA